MGLLSEIVGKSKNVLVLTHLNADPDAIGSAIAVAEFLRSKGVKAMVGCPQGINALARNLVKRLKYKVDMEPDLDSYNTVIIVDTSSPSQVAPLDIAKFGGNLHVIDHHSSDPELTTLCKSKCYNEKASSTSEIVYSLLNEEKYEIRKNVALALLGGIITDTGHLQFAKPETFRAVARLVEITKLDYAEILSQIAIPTEPSKKIAQLKAASRLEIERIDGWIIVLTYVSSFEASAARSLIKIGADAAFVCSKDQSNVRVCARASNRFVKEADVNFGRDVVPIIAEVIKGSGGGHIAAASVNGKFEGNEEELLEICFNILTKAVEEKKGK